MVIKLEDGSRIAVIGGGPAGTFTAHFITKEARLRGLDLKIKIFDAKHFLTTGPAGCNLCAGVISETLVELMRAEGINIPETRVQRKISGYTIHAPGQTVRITQPDKVKRISVVFRGNGPLCSIPDAPISFDDFLLEHVVDEGIELIQENVAEIIPSVKGSKIKVVTQKREEEFDLVIIACGINSGLIRDLTAKKIGYRPPDSLVTIQAELPIDEDWIEEHFGDDIHVFSPTFELQRFAAVIPKTKYLTVLIVPKRNATLEDLHRFLEIPSFRALLPPTWTPPKRFCTCRPRIPIGGARGAVSDRLIFVGDAAFSRSYKNGIYSAFVCAREAADAIINHGIDKKTLNENYVRSMTEKFVRDNRYSVPLFLLHDLMRRHEFMSASFVEVLTNSTEVGKSLRRVTWDILTGNRSYKESWKEFISMSLQMSLIRSTFKQFMKRAKGITDMKFGIKDELGPLKSGAKIAIIGGGPAGASAAIALIGGAKRKGIDIHVAVYEGKRYDGRGNYNPCVGVLSPPIEKILEDIGVSFPHDLVQRKIDKYVLHGRNESIELPDEKSAAYAVRRITFDRYLLDIAKERGAEILNARVVGIEIERDRVMIYSDTDSRAVDLVIGAFGMDDGAMSLFKSETSYIPPRSTQSVLTKIHPGIEMVNSYGGSIHAYLPELAGVEFGAITPKRDHVVLNIAGAKVTARELDAFLDLPQVRNILPNTIDELRPALNFFKGKFPTAPAKSYYGDRYAIIGDASGLVRPFKGKGVNAAIMTAKCVADIALNYGISKKCFSKYEDHFQNVIHDMPFGTALRGITKVISKTGLLDKIIRIAKKEVATRRMLFDCISAHRTYGEIWSDFRKNGLMKLLWKLIFK
ncbi:MAG: hypothetical protein COS94_02000 [Candidatus Hydrogenedentes bacterium CG07_land_8_20_14_0_80_42_17]|nr:MAG: hypothetical protein COS94_02000 [Candidatus Hydrogenedentes bacterium CG07_land_8_20_14_0_80_42_17]